MNHPVPSIALRDDYRSVYTVGMLAKLRGRSRGWEHLKMAIKTVSPVDALLGMYSVETISGEQFYVEYSILSKQCWDALHQRSVVTCRVATGEGGNRYIFTAAKI